VAKFIFTKLEHEHALKEYLLDSYTW